MKVRDVIWGKVGAGEKRGKALGFPTANVALHKEIIDGVYLSKVRINNNNFSALTFIGAAKTFNQQKKIAESYILNFNKDIYGEWISIKLLKKIRGNIKFKSKEELVKQMQRDLIIAKDFFIH